ncbi:MAG: TetR/AcrR family transcriptional regulator [Solirubrobacteraceae bacterium]
MFHDRHFADGDGVPAEAPPQASTLTVAQRGDPRRRMLDAMIHTVALRGYERATVSRMLTYAELPEAVFSEHFTDKHDCFMQALDELITSAERAAIEHFALPVPWRERVRDALGSLVDALVCNEDAARVLFVEMLAAGPAALERQHQALELFTSLVEQGRSLAPHADQLAPQTSEAIVGGIASILHRRALQGEVAQLPTLLPELVYFVLLPYLDQSEAMSAAELPTAA